jgi:hypothetical protein
MKYAVAIAGVLAMIVTGLVVYELVTGNSTIQAKQEKQSNVSNNLAKLVVIQAYDKAQKTFVVTPQEFTGIDSSIVFSSDTNLSVNATLDNIANFFLAHSGPTKPSPALINHVP